MKRIDSGSIIFRRRSDLSSPGFLSGFEHFGDTSWLYFYPSAGLYELRYGKEKEKELGNGYVGLLTRSSYIEVALMI